jgi:hypothetical protein
VNEDDARRAGLRADEYAAQVAAEWRAGLESQGLGPGRIAAFRGAADLAVYTPARRPGEIAEQLEATDAEWAEKAAAIETVAIRPEASDVRVAALALVWVPTN